MLYAVGNQLKGTLLNTVSLLAGKPSLFILYSYSQVYLRSFRGNKSHHFPHKATELKLQCILSCLSLKRPDFTIPATLSPHNITYLPPLLQFLTHNSFSLQKRSSFSCCLQQGMKSIIKDMSQQYVLTRLLPFLRHYRQEQFFP